MEKTHVGGRREFTWPRRLSTRTPIFFSDGLYQSPLIQTHGGDSRIS